MSVSIKTVKACDIVAGVNDRKEFNHDELASLAASIKAHGLAQPPTLRPVGNNFEIVAGERRVRAMRDVLKWTDIPAIVRELSDEDASAIMLAENVHRVDLDPIAEATAYGTRMAMFDQSPAEVAELANVPVSRVRSRLALLSLCEPIARLVAIGQLPIRFAAVMTSLDVNRQHLALAAFNQTEAMGYPTFSALCSRLQMEQDQESLFDPQSFFQIEEYVADAAMTADVKVAIDPVGQQDIAKRLGVAPKTVSQWIQREVFKVKPKWIVSGMPVYNWADVVEWDNERKAKK